MRTTLRLLPIEVGSNESSFKNTIEEVNVNGSDSEIKMVKEEEVEQNTHLL